MLPQEYSNAHYATKWYFLGDLSIPIQKIPGSNEAGLVAIHPTGWTGLVAKLFQQSCGSTDYF